MKNLIINNKFLQILRKINLKTQKRFSVFLKGLYATKKIQLALFDYLLEAAPKFEDENHLQLDKAYQAVFKKSLVLAKDRKNLLNAFSDLTKWLEDFLLLKKLEEKSVERNTLLHSIYKKLDLLKNQQHVMQKTYDDLSTETSEAHHLLFQYNELLYFESTKGQAAIPSQHLENGLKYLDNFYIHKKLKYSSELASRKEILNEPSSLNLSKKELLQLPKYILTTTDLNKIYWLHFQLFTTANQVAQEKIYTTLKDLVFNYPIKDNSLQHQSLIYAANYAIQRMRIGDNRFQAEILALYEYGLAENILIQNEVFPVSPFLNLVKIYCRQQQFITARTFLETYTKKLPTAFRQDSYHLGRAEIYIGQKKYTKANKFLNRIQFRHPRFDVEATLFAIICSIELHQTIAYYSQVQRVQKIFTNESTLPKKIIHSIQYFLELSLHLVLKDLSKEALKAKINHFPSLPHKSWFMEKI